MIGCKPCINNDIYLFVNVCLPYQCQEHFDDYITYLGKLISYTVLVGDFNAEVGNILENELLTFAKTFNLYMSYYRWYYMQY